MIIAPKEKRVAFCSSKPCFDLMTDKYQVQNLGEGAVRKEVKSGTFECPDCGYALFWSRNYAPRQYLRRYYEAQEMTVPGSRSL